MDNVASIHYFWPELAMVAVTLAIFIVDLPLRRRKRPVLSGLMFVGLFASLVLTLLTQVEREGPLFLGMISIDPFAVFFKILFLVTAALVTIFSLQSSEVREEHFSEYLALIAATTLGAMLLAASAHMLMVFLTLELVSVPCYILSGYMKRSQRSSEAGLKYVIYGAASSGLMVYGISLLYGVTGSLSFEGIRSALWSMDGNEFVVLTSLVFILAGIGYKIAIFPFHMWSPDVYEGAPTPITAFLSVGPKAAGFAVLVRMLLEGFSIPAEGGTHFIDASHIDWPLLVAVISAATMSLGNLLAINQDNIKRMLAYSSIAHAGYILMGVVALTVLGVQAVIFYFIVYLLMNLGAFLVVISLRNETGSEAIDEYRGLGWSSGAGAVVAVAMTIFLFSLTGIPPFGGFVGKVYLFASVIADGRFGWLAIVAIVNSVISLYYYARVVKMMFLRGYEPGEMEGVAPHAPSASILTVLVVLAVAVTISGVFWGPLARWVGSSAELFFR